MDETADESRDIPRNFSYNKRHHLIQLYLAIRAAVGFNQLFKGTAGCSAAFHEGFVNLRPRLAEYLVEIRGNERPYKDNNPASLFVETGQAF